MHVRETSWRTLFPSRPSLLAVPFHYAVGRRDTLEKELLTCLMQMAEPFAGGAQPQSGDISDCQLQLQLVTTESKGYCLEMRQQVGRAVSWQASRHDRCGS